MLPFLSAVRSMAPLLQEPDLGSSNVSGFVVHANPDFLAACVLQMPNHEDLRALIYPWAAQHPPPCLLAEFVVVAGLKYRQPDLDSAPANDYGTSYK